MVVDGVMVNRKLVDKYLEHSMGYCIECGHIEEGPCEPDAVNYQCSCCGEKSVVGFENAVAYGWVVATDEKYPMLGKYLGGEDGNS